MKFLTNLNMTSNQLLNVVIHKLSEEPAGISGQIYYDTTKERLFYHNGTKWVGSDALDAVMSGDGIVEAINSASTTITISDARLSAAVRTAVTNSHSKTHTIGMVTGLQTALDDKVASERVKTDVPAGAIFSDTTYDVFNTTKDGLVPKTTTSNATDYLRRDGTWATPPNSDTKYTAGANIQISGGNVISATDKDTTYTAGEGLTLSSTTFLVDFDKVPRITDSRFTDARAPLPHVHGNLTNDGKLGTSPNLILKTGTGGLVETLAVGAPGQYLSHNGSWGTPPNNNTTYTAGTALALSGTTFNVTLGTGATDAARGDDPRFSDPRTPLSHAHGSITNDGKIGAVAGLMIKTGAAGKLETLAKGIAGQFLSSDGTWATPELPSGDGFSYVPATGTNSNGKVLTAGATAGSFDWQTPKIAWGNISGRPSSTPSAIDTAVTNSHGHTNKALLDTYTQTNANLADAVTKKHAQNTDIGTSSTTFYLGSGGAKIKGIGNIEIQVRNSADTDYLDLRVKNLYVEGSHTTISSNEVNIGDNQILLNSDVTLAAHNSDGGLAIKRLMANNSTRKDAEINYNNSTNRWETISGNVAGTLVTATLTNKIVASIGNGTLKAFNMIHNLNTRDVSVSVRQTNSPYEQVMTDVSMDSLNAISLTFAVAPLANEYTVTIIG